MSEMLQAPTMEEYFSYILRHIDVHRRQNYGQKSKMVVEIRSMEFWRAIVGESVATCLLVYLAGLSTLSWGQGHQSVTVIALSYGLSVAILNHCFSGTSGGHCNPAITLAVAVTFRISFLRLVFYVIAQCGGAIAGAALLYGITPQSHRGNLSVTIPHPDVSPEQAFGTELLLSFVLIFAYFSATDSNKIGGCNSSLALGIAVMVNHLAAYEITGSSMNPARSLGPAFITHQWTHHWIYWIAPMLGGSLAALMYQYIFDPYRKTKSITQVLQQFERDSIQASSTRTTSSGLHGNYNDRDLYRTGRRSSTRPHATHMASDNIAYDESMYQIEMEGLVNGRAMFHDGDIPDSIPPSKY